MIKRLHLGYIAAVFAILVGAAYIGQTAWALGRKSPENGFYTMRYHSSGNVLQTTLAIYTKNGVQPNNARFDINKAGLGCQPSKLQGKNDTKTKDIRVAITVGSRNLYNKELGDSTCKGGSVFKTYTVPNDQWYPSNGRWRVDLTLSISGGDNGNPGWYDSRNNDERRAWFQFTATAESGLLMTNRENRYGSTDYETNYGVTSGDDSNYGSGNDNRTLYEMPFARPCSSGTGETTEIAGVWDPDEFYNRIKVQERVRAGGGGWTDTAIVRASGMNGGQNGAGYYTPNEGSDVAAYLQFKMRVDREYKIVMITDPSNVLSLFWPYDSIQSDLSCNYELNPAIDIGGKSSIDPGATAPVNTSVDNTNPTAYGTDTTRRMVTKFVYNSMPSDTAKKDYKSTDACGSYTATNRVSCGVGSPSWAPGVDAPVSLRSPPNSQSFNYVASTSEIGKYVCFVNSVNWPRDSLQRDAAHTWRHSNMVCMQVAKRPKIQVLGSDLRVQGLINTSVSEDIAAKTYGSWIEYGVFSTGINTTASSGSGLKNGNTNSSSSAWSNLTFTNNTTTLGKYTPLVSSNATTYFTNLASTQPATFTGGNISGLNGVYKASGDISLSGNITDHGKSIIIYSPGTVTINGPIAINGSGLTSVKDISQVVIVAKNIKISQSVVNVDAWLLAMDSINTCAEKNPASPQLTINDCNQPLRVNGAVVTKKLYLLRTAKADKETPGEAAEIFNLRPDAYLWAYNYVNKRDYAQTVYTTELPPRF